MDILTLNALGIALMAALGLWVFYRAARTTRSPSDKDRSERGS